MVLEFALVALVAGATGYWFARRRAPGALTEIASSPGFRGRILGLVPGGSADLGVDYLLTHVPITRESVHIHLAVASLARERGETDDAVRVHKHLLEHIGELVGDAPSSDDVHMELVRDYLAAGLLDRAESELVQLIERGDPVAGGAEEHLLEVYQRERDWTRAAELGRRLVNAGNEKVRRYLAHFLCEMAEGSGVRKAERESLYKEAVEVDPTCVRALLAAGALQIENAQLDRALASYHRAFGVDTRFAVEALKGLRLCHSRAGTLANYVEWLAEQSTGDRGAVALEQVNVLRLLGRAEEALAILRSEIAARPNAAAFRELIHQEELSGQTPPGDALRAYAEACIDDRSAYQCEACGFSSHLLLWSCPSCKRWSSVLPVGVGASLPER